MDGLPGELLDIIAGFLPGKGLAPYATLSSRWQRAIERRTFSKLRIQSVDEDMDSLGRSVTPCRLEYLRQLDFTVMIPLHERQFDELDKPFKTRLDEQQEGFSFFFTEAIQKLFQVLADIESSSKEVTVSAAKRSGIRLFIREVKSIYDGSLILHEYRAHRARPVGLSEYESFPPVYSISHLGIRDPRRQVALRTGIELSTRLPNLHVMDLATKQQGFRRFSFNFEAILETRHGLAEALSKAEFLSGRDLHHLTLTVDDFDVRDIRAGLFWARYPAVFPNCHASTIEPSYDPVSSAIRTLSHNLISLNLRGTFDGSLFWPSEAEPDGDNILSLSSLQWPSLKHTTVKMGFCTPNGGWHVRAKPEAVAQEGVSRPFLNVPCEAEMQTLFASWSKGLSRMPVLESATICFQMERERVNPDSSPRRVHWAEKRVIGFQAPGQIPNPAIFTSHDARLTLDELQSPRIVFERTYGWRPSTTTMDRLREMARDRFSGRSLVEIDVDETNNVTRK